MRTLQTLVLAALFCGAAAMPAPAQIANGSFESGDYTGWTLFQGSNSVLPQLGTWGIAVTGQTVNSMVPLPLPLPLLRFPRLSGPRAFRTPPSCGHQTTRCAR